MPKGKTGTKVCDICSKEISLFAYNRHVKSHSNQLNKIVNHKETICKFCGNEYIGKTSLGNHVARCRLNRDRKIQTLTESGRQKIRDSNGKWSEERKEKHKLSMRNAVLQNKQSYSASNVCGRVKIYNYNGDKFHGLWELDVAKWLDSKNIPYIRDIEPIPYLWNDEEHLYFPDFYLPLLDIYVEVKGYERDRDIAKWCNIKNLLVIRAKEIELIRNDDYKIVV